jgi:PTH1 family peptidyl-tRNA hydrolase
VALRRRRDGDRRGAPSDLVIVGLANPGEEFESSRHNVGGDAVRELAGRLGVGLKVESRQRCISGTFDALRGRVTLAVPTTFMNDSGAAFPPLLKRTSLVDLHTLVVAHDELDLEPGRLQLKMGGGLAGHNGLRSISSAVRSDEFGRLRIGIGKPPSKEQGADHVLTQLRGRRRDELRALVEAAADALALVIEVGFDEAQQRVNAAARG